MVLEFAAEGRRGYSSCRPAEKNGENPIEAFESLEFALASTREVLV
jgi:hypothetical protein